MTTKKFYVQSKKNLFDNTVSFNGQFISQEEFDKFFNKSKSKTSLEEFEAETQKQREILQFCLKINSLFDSVSEEKYAFLPFDLAGLKNESSLLLSKFNIDESTLP